MMKTLVISDQYGIFCGMNGNYACFSKDALLAAPMAYGFENDEKATTFISKMPKQYQSQMKLKEINFNEHYIPLHVLIKEGFGDHTGYMLDMLVPEDSTKH